MKQISIWVSEETESQVRRIVHGAPAAHEALVQQWEIAKRALHEHTEVCTETKCILKDRLQDSLDALALARRGCVVTAQLMVQISRELDMCRSPLSKPSRMRDF